MSDMPLLEMLSVNDLQEDGWSEG